MKKRFYRYLATIQFIFKLIYILFVLTTLIYYFAYYAFILFELMTVELSIIHRRITFFLHDFLDDMSRRSIDFYRHHHPQPKDSVIGLCLANLIGWVIGSGKVLFRGKNTDPLNDEEFYYLVTTYAFLCLFYAKLPEAVDNYILTAHYMYKRDFLVLLYGFLFFLWAYRQSLNEIAVYEWYADLWPHDKKMVVGFTIFCLIAYPIVGFYFPKW